MERSDEGNQKGSARERKRRRMRRRRRKRKRRRRRRRRGHPALKLNPFFLSAFSPATNISLSVGGGGGEMLNNGAAEVIDQYLTESKLLHSRD